MAARIYVSVNYDARIDGARALLIVNYQATEIGVVTEADVAAMRAEHPGLEFEIGAGAFRAEARQRRAAG